MKGPVAILLVGDYPPLLATRSQLLREWDVVVVHPFGAQEALRQRPYSLLILCQSLSEATAAKILTLATSVYPTIKILALTFEGERRNLTGATMLHVDIYKPGVFRDEVAHLLGGPVSGGGGQG